MTVDLTRLDAEQKRQLLEALQKDAVPTKRKRRRADTVKYLSEEQLDRFFGVITDPRDVAMFRIIYHRGLRASEVGLLQLDDWNRDRDRLRFVRLKGSNGGEYHLTSREVRALRAWLKIRGVEPGPLFPSRQSHGRGISIGMIEVLMKRYGQQAGLPPELCHPHTLKHSCGTHLMNRGLAIEEIQDHMGHVNVQSTLLYARFSPKRREIADQRLREW